MLSASTQNITLPVCLAVSRDSILKQKTLKQVQGAGSAFLLQLGSPGRGLHPLLRWDTHHFHKKGENTIIASLLLLHFCLCLFLAYFFSSRGLQGGRVNLRSSEWLKGKIIKALVRCRHMTPVRRLYA